MNRKIILLLALIISDTIGAWPLVAYSSDIFDMGEPVSRSSIPVQSARSLNQEELQKLIDHARRGIAPDQRKSIRDAVMQSGILDEFEEEGLSSLVLSPLEKKLVILYTDRIAQIEG